MTDNTTPPRKRGFRPIARASVTPVASEPNPPGRRRQRPAPVSDSAAAPVNPPPMPEPEPTAKAEYEIGYGKPPKHTRFQPGQSGNPKGRKKGTKGMKTITKEVLTSKVVVRTAEGPKKMTTMEALMRKFMEMALKGNPRAAITLFNMYQSAIPDVAEDAGKAEAAPLSKSDEETLAILRQMFLDEEGTEA